MSADVKEVVREKYREAAERAASGSKGGCCGTSGGCGADASDPITRDLYDEVTASSLPEQAVLASLGCGNPTALAELGMGEVVLDLGSGGGIDVLLSARRVGREGKAYGLDMTEEMLTLARRNAAEAGAENVEFLKGDIESIPLPDGSVDVIISNCVINLSADKEQVLREAYRVLKPGGRFAVSDVVVRGEIPAEVRRSMELWVGCVAGALEEREFERMLLEAGFEDPSFETTRVYEPEDARAMLEEAGLRVDALADAVDGRLVSAFVRARKPEDAADAGPVLRSATPRDRNAVVRLLGESGLPTGDVEPLLSRFVVAEAGERLVGVAGLEIHGADGLLRSVAVDPAFRGRGLGGDLTEWILQIAREEGLRRLYLLTTTAADFFPRYGFRRIGRDEASSAIRESGEFREACPASAVAMSLELESLELESPT